MSIIKFIKNWTLPVSMMLGALSYVAYRELACIHSWGPMLLGVVGVVQPFLIFMMLFITFCKMDTRQLRPTLMHLWLLLLQVIAFLLAAWISHGLPYGWNVTIEAFMICMICPTATAGVVVTAKLGGDAESLTVYTILVNLAVAFLIPAVIPLLHPHAQWGFATAFLLIVSRVFPTLIFPLLAALLARKCMPRFHQAICSRKDLAFHIWSFSLALAIAMTVRSLYHNHTSLWILAGIALSSLLSCVLQFWAGRKIGLHYHQPIAAGQSLGQKNTVFAIWMGYTFLNPVVSVAGGFYSIWHNVYNSWQLAEKRKRDARAVPKG